MVSGTDLGGGQAGLPPPTKIWYLKISWEPSFYPTYYFTFFTTILYFLISLLFSSNYHLPIAILIVNLTLKGLVSISAFINLCLYFAISLGVFHIFLWSLFWTKYVFTHLEAATRRFSGKQLCISHLPLIIVLNKIYVFIHLEAANRRSSTK